MVYIIRCDVKDAVKNFEYLTVFDHYISALEFAVREWDRLTDEEKLSRRIYIFNVRKNAEHFKIPAIDCIVWDSWQYEHEQIAEMIENDLKEYMEEKHVIVIHSSGEESSVRDYIMQELKLMDDAARKLTLVSDVPGGWVLDVFMDDVDNTTSEDWCLDKTYRLTYIGEGDE